MTWQVQPVATEGAYGRVSLDACTYAPLATAHVRVRGRAKGDTRCTLRACDPGQRAYWETQLDLCDNAGAASFTVGGPLGTHYLYLVWPDEQRHHSRYLNFVVDAETSVRTGDQDFDALYPFTRDSLRRGRRQYETPRGRFVGYMSADTWHFDGIWLRDWIYGLPAYRHWEREMACGLDRFLEVQSADGMICDGIERDGRTWRVGLESDVEYIVTLAVWQTWQTTGDDAWLRAALPRLEAALRYIQSDPKHWDPAHRLIKRQHSCDTWDFDIDGATDKGLGRHVIATCDQTGYYLAFAAMARMHAHLGDEAAAARWRATAAGYRERAAALLWDGKKFQHHVHLDAIDHGDFDERAQLAMSNTWAMTRGLATPEQAAAIIDEYQYRHAATGDAYPWWSLQPGYPDHLGYFKQRYCQQGGYANGGLMPWVGGELCRAAFWFGREAYGVALLRQYTDHLRRTGGAQVWYWPDGTPGFRTTNEVPYACWGMAEWLAALTEGLAGVRDEAACLREVSVAPRWPAAGLARASVCVHYAASGAYVAYEWAWDAAAKTMSVTFTGSGDRAAFSLLLPADWTPATLTVNGTPTTFALRRVADSFYADFAAPLSGVSCAVLK